MSPVEKYLKPEVIRQIGRLDLRAQFIVKGFLQGLHSSPFHGFSVEFSEHRKYTPGDDPDDIDWLVYAKTDKYYVKKFEAETNTARGLNQIAAIVNHRSMIMRFSDFLADPGPILLSLRRLRHGGHDVILFHVLDEAEVRFPFDGVIEFEEPEAEERLQVDASS